MNSSPALKLSCRAARLRVRADADSLFYGGVYSYGSSTKLTAPLDAE